MIRSLCWLTSSGHCYANYIGYIYCSLHCIEYTCACPVCYHGNHVINVWVEMHYYHVWKCDRGRVGTHVKQFMDCFATEDTMAFVANQNILAR